MALNEITVGVDTDFSTTINSNFNRLDQRNRVTLSVVSGVIVAANALLVASDDIAVLNALTTPTVELINSLSPDSSMPDKMNSNFEGNEDRALEALSGLEDLTPKLNQLLNQYSIPTYVEDPANISGSLNSFSYGFSQATTFPSLVNENFSLDLARNNEYTSKAIEAARAMEKVNAAAAQPALNITGLRSISGSLTATNLNSTYSYAWSSILEGFSSLAFVYHNMGSTDDFLHVGYFRTGGDFVLSKVTMGVSGPVATETIGTLAAANLPPTTGTTHTGGISTQAWSGGVLPSGNIILVRFFSSVDSSDYVYYHGASKVFTPEGAVVDTDLQDSIYTWAPEANANNVIVPLANYQCAFTGVSGTTIRIHTFTRNYCNPDGAGTDDYEHSHNHSAYIYNEATGTASSSSTRYYSHGSDSTAFQGTSTTFLYGGQIYHAVVFDFDFSDGEGDSVIRFYKIDAASGSTTTVDTTQYTGNPDPSAAIYRHLNSVGFYLYYEDAAADEYGTARFYTADTLIGTYSWSNLASGAFNPAFRYFKEGWEFELKGYTPTTVRYAAKTNATNKTITGLSSFSAPACNYFFVRDGVNQLFDWDGTNLLCYYLGNTTMSFATTLSLPGSVTEAYPKEYFYIDSYWDVPLTSSYTFINGGSSATVAGGSWGAVGFNPTDLEFTITAPITSTAALDYLGIEYY